MGQHGKVCDSMAWLGKLVQPVSEERNRAQTSSASGRSRRVGRPGARLSLRREPPGAPTLPDRVVGLHLTEPGCGRPGSALFLGHHPADAIPLSSRRAQRVAAAAAVQKGAGAKGWKRGQRWADWHDRPGPRRSWPSICRSRRALRWAKACSPSMAYCLRVRCTSVWWRLCSRESWAIRFSPGCAWLATSRLDRRLTRIIHHVLKTAAVCVRARAAGE
jgi:hypothetical protein